MNYGEILFSRFVYSAWEGHKCTVPISEGEKRKILDELYLCGTGNGEFPKKIMNYPTKFYGHLEGLNEKNVRDYIYYKHPTVIFKHIGDIPEKILDGIKKNCIVWVCEAINSEKVKHPLGHELKPKKDFCSFEKGDLVSVHWNYSLEKVDEAFGKEINEKIINSFL